MTPPNTEAARSRRTASKDKLTAPKARAAPKRKLLDALERGWSVVPQRTDKHAFVPWKTYQERPPTEADVRAWIDEHPGAMWALVTGQVSGVIALDFDGEEGCATYERLGLKASIRTPSGGYHVYIEAPAWPVKGGARVAPERFPGMDLRADGQLATFHGQRNGGRYRQLPDRHIYSYNELPSEVRTLLQERKKHAPSGTAELPDGFDTFAAGDDLLQEAVVKATEEGSREAGGFHLACQLRDERLDERDGEEAVMAVGRRYVDAVAKLRSGHPYTMQEFYNSWVSAVAHPRRDPRAVRRGVAYQPLTDLGNAERLVTLHGEDLRYCHQWNAWLVWDERRWKRDATAEAVRHAKLTAREMRRAAVDLTDQDHQKALVKWARQTESASRLSAMMKLAQSDELVSTEPSDLDADPWVLNVLNGTVDLRSGKLRPHRRDDLITKLAPVSYDPTARSARWERFLERVMPDPDDRAFLQRAVGYSLTGDVSEHVLFILHGSGRNGKSTFIEAIRGALGDYGQQATSELLLSKRPGGATEDTARLHGRRFVAASETAENRRLDEALVKQLTGGDTLTARYLYANFFEFQPTHKLWLATNHLPQVRGTDEAIWARIRQVPFTVQLPAHERDKKLPQKLHEESSGILTWAVEGCLEWQRHGLGESANVELATETYREESDVFGRFLEDRCVIGDEHEVSTTDLYSAYTSWAVSEGLREMSKVAFGRKLSERGFAKVKLDGGSVRGWRGLGRNPGTDRARLKDG